MITVTLYLNGVSVEGHSTDEICSLVSFATWSLFSNLCNEYVDNKYYTSHFDAPTEILKKTEGKTFLEFDNRGTMAKDYFANYKTNLKNWVDYNFKEEVLIVNKKVDGQIEPLYLDRLKKNGSI